ncbi:type IV pilin N-terminal domain-containing protein [Halorubrum yunnanense]|uniref:Type IV pilin N-terminal domain-containing protein n=1 Tax=Halorubrum yunnanense TaxID=1526162 RepID=A0ABD5YF21_9EURY|nr:type IV pilin N-terminal domain-containing protein [Halorubrum yunnanense]
MKPTNLFNTDDRAVSPVIGVILMVAITVILAAVIGTFVLGLGDSLGDSQPTASIGIEAGSETGEVVISHNGGDALTGSELDVVDGSGNSLSGSPPGDLSVGGSVTVSSEKATETTVRVIHTPSETILAENTVDLS